MESNNQTEPRKKAKTSNQFDDDDDYQEMMRKATRHDKESPTELNEKRIESVAEYTEKFNNSNYSNPFNFTSTWLKEYTKVIFNHTSSGYMQIDIKALQNLAYLFCYGGLRTPAFYILDLCPSGAGKSANIHKNRELLLTPIYELQSKILKDDIERYNSEIVSAKSNKDKEIVKPPQLHKCIHSSDTSKEALFESFEAVKAQLIEVGELGQKLKKTDPVIDYICDGFGNSSLDAPNFKNQRYSETIKINGISLFFIGDTNLQYLGKKAFYNHLQGGLINRCFIVYDDYIPNYEEIPNFYHVEESIKHKYNSVALNIISFARNNKDFKISNSYMLNKELKAYERELHNIKKAMTDERNVFGNLYHRSIQNLRSIIEILHLIKCFECNRNAYTKINQ